ncbi:MAG: pyruvate, phosphate dikinase [Candidatus Limnocylindrales bacterium]
MTYVHDLTEHLDLSYAEARALLGGKAANLATMATELRLPVPPGFVVTTEACRAYLASGWPAGLDEELRAHVHTVEAATGRTFGGPGEPLLVSVRSGAPISMPGMMDTILDLGLEAGTTAGLAAATGDTAFATQCRARFETMFRAVVGVADVPADPWAQLRGAVEAVFRSWNSARARTYREREGIPADLGTAVTVQAMVFGNRGMDSGTGVLFTRNPATGEPLLYGDFLFDAQGEDVVAGTHQTESLAALDERLPAVARELRRTAVTLECHYRDLCDIEFTVERGKLWLLQVRVGKRTPQAALRLAVDMAQDPDFPLSRAEAVARVQALLERPPLVATGPCDAVALTSGLPASPGVASGEIATSCDLAIRAAEAGRRVILVRNETSPDDVPGLSRSVGILTARGGLASHAAVVARGWGIPAVVGASALHVDDGHITIGLQVLQAGETITIDGGTGEVFAGEVGGSTTVVPEAAILLGWAHDLGILIGSPEGERTTAAPAHASAGVDDVLAALAVKGFATPESLAAALLSGPDEVQPLLAGLVTDGLTEEAVGALRLTEAGKARSQALLATEQEGWGTAAATEALDRFLALDGRMKETVTAWQMRAQDGPPVLNDHSDPAYDRSVLERLVALDADAGAWLAPLTSGPARLVTYRQRLQRALEAALAGDQRYVASPRVDSYHSVWFELHEDLIRLAGRTRAAETAAGRA